METNQQRLPITRTIEVSFIEGDVVAETRHDKLLLTGKGIMIKDDKGNESYHCWNSFIKYYAHLRLVELSASVLSGIVEQHKGEI